MANTPQNSSLAAVLRAATDDDIARALVGLGRQRIGGVVLGLKAHLTAELQSFVLNTWITGQAGAQQAETLGGELGKRLGRGLADFLKDSKKPRE